LLVTWCLDQNMREEAIKWRMKGRNGGIQLWYL